MAVDVKPVLVIAGEVIEVTKNEFLDRESGEVKDKGRVAVVKTARGFVELKLPVRSASVEIAAGDVGAWYVTPFEWGMVNRGDVAAVRRDPQSAPEPRVRYGVAYLFEESLPRDVAAGILGLATVGS